MALPLFKPESMLAEVELLQLLDRADHQARDRLRRFGSVWPFGAYVCPSGYVHPLESDPANYALPHYLQYEILHDRLVNMAWRDRLIAYTLVAEIALPEEIDPRRMSSLRVHFESAELSVYHYRPFTLAPCRSEPPDAADRRRIRFLEPVVTPAGRHVFEAAAR